MLFVAIPVSSSAVSAYKIPHQSQAKIDNNYAVISRIPPGGSLLMKPNPFKMILNSYSSALLQFPSTTKAVTAFFLYALSDVIAQIQGLEKKIQSVTGNDRISHEKKNERRCDITWIDQMHLLNMPRLLKFSIKGVLGTSIWEVWFNYTEELLNRNNICRLLKLVGVAGPDGTCTISRVTQKSTQVFLLILLEQFVASPIYFGAYELPLSTVLNGAPLSRIPHEIEEKLVTMLYANAKVWTGANVIVYSAPLQYRTVICNIFNVFWQIIVSNFSADCGE